VKGLPKYSSAFKGINWYGWFTGFIGLQLALFRLNASQIPVSDDVHHRFAWLFDFAEFMQGCSTNEHPYSFPKIGGVPLQFLQSKYHPLSTSKAIVTVEMIISE
jgi:hypothetical protein